MNGGVIANPTFGGAASVVMAYAVPFEHPKRSVVHSDRDRDLEDGFGIAELFQGFGVDIRVAGGHVKAFDRIGKYVSLNVTHGSPLFA
jgi:hypothetical protein